MKKQKTGSAAYAKAGVNLSAGDEFISFAGKVGTASFHNSRYVNVVDCSKGHFRGPRGWQYTDLPEGYFHVLAPDGIGTATIIVSAAGAHRTSSSRLLAMTAGDISRFGGLSLVFTNVLETKRLGEPDSKLFKAHKDLVTGLGEYAHHQGYILMGGETAEMNDCVSGEIMGDTADVLPTYNWSGVMIGVNHPDKLIDGSSLKPGQRIVALRDRLRSNGGSMLRKFFKQKFSWEWWRNPDARGAISDAASPAVLYDHFLSWANGWFSGPDFQPYFKMRAIAHLSGGGIKSKFAEDLLFPRGLSADLDDLWEVPQFMQECVDDMGLTDPEAYTIFNGGQGALVVVDEESDKIAPILSIIDQKERLSHLGTVFVAILDASVENDAVSRILAACLEAGGHGRSVRPRLAIEGHGFSVCLYHVVGDREQHPAQILVQLSS